MATYIIHNDNVTAYEQPPTGMTGVRRYEEFLRETKEWPGSRLVSLYNNLATAQGKNTVSKFMNRDAGKKRLWELFHNIPVTTPQATAPMTKKEKVLTMIQTPHGATLEEIMSATGWQPHSVRGFLSTQKQEYAVERITRTDNSKAYYATKREP